MCVYTHVSCRAAQTLAFTVGYMLFCLGIAILFRHTEVDDMYNICIFSSRSADEKVVWLYITVYKILLMYSLHSGNLRMDLAIRSRDNSEDRVYRVGR